jgi:hypothetical protein
MSRGYVEAAAIIPAPPETVYGIIADYRDGHPHILPEPYFSNLEVEQGGIGAGTIMTFKIRIFGVEHAARQIVSEPEPGRVLVEKSMKDDLVTTFTVTPANGGQQSHLKIETDWAPRPGLSGWIEKQVTRWALRSIYVKELRQLAAYVQNKPAPTNNPIK